MALAQLGYKVSVLDQDFDGSTIPKLFGVMDKRMKLGEKGLKPVEGLLGIQMVSLGLIQKESEVVTMFHDMRRGTTEEFLAHVDYGERDFLLVDLPPGTSSDAVNLMQYIPDLNGLVVVTIPPYVSQLAARKAAQIAMKAETPVLGIIENMSGYVCHKCGSEFDVLQRGGGERGEGEDAGGGEKLAEELGVNFLGRIPLNKELSEASDAGEPFVYKYPDNPGTKGMMDIATRLVKLLEEGV